MTRSVVRNARIGIVNSWYIGMLLLFAATRRVVRNRTITHLRAVVRCFYSP